MRQLFLIVVVGAFMAMSGFVAAQVPTASILGGNAPAGELPLGPSSSSRTGVLPGGEGSGPWVIPASLQSQLEAQDILSVVRSAPIVGTASMQSQLEAQQKEVNSLIKTVRLLSEQVQQTPEAGAERLNLAPAPVDLGAAREELRKAELTLAELQRQQAAAAQAPADEQLKKQLDLQRKQIEVLNRMIRLLASQLEKLDPAVNRMQTQVATLQARSRQGAQRDQELANGLDNLTEHIDSTQRNGLTLPAPLKELFDPSYNYETPLSIYGALVERYHQFNGPSGAFQNPGVFETPTLSLFFLLTLSQRIFLESNVDFSTKGVDVPWAQIDFLVSDWLTAVVGRYLVPIGFYNERLSYEWGNKLPDDPLMFHQVSPLASTNGAQLRGSTYLFGSPVKLEYSLYGGNGMQLSATPATVADLADLSVLASSDETNAKAVGGRLGLWVPQWGINGGVSAYYDHDYAQTAPRLDLNIISVDANYHRGNWDARFEAAHMNQQAAAIIGRDIQRSGLYAQLGYRPYHVASYFLQRLEFVGRYGLERFVGIDPSALDFTTFSDLTFVPVDRNQYTCSLNYYFYPSLILKFAYEINQELHGINLHDNVFFSQMVWAF